MKCIRWTRPAIHHRRVMLGEVEREEGLDMERFTDTLRQAAGAIMDAWQLGDEMEKAQLSAAFDIVQEVLAQRQSIQENSLKGEAFL